MKKSTKESLLITFFIVVAFILGGTGLVILFNTKGDWGSVIGGFVLVGLAISSFYKAFQYG